MIDGNAIRPRKEFRMTHQQAADTALSVRAREACLYFGVPYAAVSLSIYGSEIRRLTGRANQQGMLTTGCLNQTWDGPMIVWYPEGNWMELPHEKD